VASSVSERNHKTYKITNIKIYQYRRRYRTFRFKKEFYPPKNDSRSSARDFLFFISVSFCIF
jgi:hypothetical protein